MYVSRVLTLDQQQLAEELIRAGESDNEISRRFGVSSGVIGRVRRDIRVPPRPPGSARRHAIQDDAFSVLSPEAAYWLGFGYADFCVWPAQNLVRLELAARDASHVEKFRAFAGSTQTISRRVHPHPAAAVSIVSARIVDDLINRWDMLPRKTWIDHPAPLELAESFAFWAGMLDGDGYLTPPSRSADGAPELGFLGTRALMEQCADFVAPLTVRRPRPHLHYASEGCELWTVVATGTSARRIAQAVYSAVPEALPLARKRSLLNEVETYTSRHDAPRWVLLDCIKCRREYRRHESQLRRDRSRFCSEACKREWERERTQRLDAPVLRMLEQGMSSKQISLSTGEPPYKVNRRRRRQGAAPAARGMIAIPELARLPLLEAALKGPKALQEAALHLGVPTPIIERNLDELLKRAPVIAMYRSPASLSSIVAESEVTNVTVRNWARWAGLPPRTPFGHPR